MRRRASCRRRSAARAAWSASGARCGRAPARAPRRRRRSSEGGAMERCSTSTIFIPSTKSGKILQVYSNLQANILPSTLNRSSPAAKPPTTTNKSWRSGKLQMPTPTRSAPSQYKAGPATAPLTNCRRLQRPDHSASNRSSKATTLQASFLTTASERPSSNPSLPTVLTAQPALFAHLSLELTSHVSSNLIFNTSHLSPSKLTVYIARPSSGAAFASTGTARRRPGTARLYTSAK